MSCDEAATHSAPSNVDKETHSHRIPACAFPKYLLISAWLPRL